MARVAFLGTPEVAVPFLQWLAREHSVAGVVTRPDAARGRSSRPRPSPVAVAAGELGLPVARPDRSPDLAGALRDFGPIDVGVVVAYGSLIKPDALAVPADGHLNVHFSLLPRWRGAAPVQRAILAGDSVTGVTVMRLDQGMDTGPYLGVMAFRIGPEQTAGDMFEVLVPAGIELLGDVLDGRPTAVPQHGEGSHAPKIGREEIRLSVEDPAFLRKVRAFSPSPGAWLEHRGERLRVLRARPLDRSMPAGELEFDGRVLACGVAGGAVELVELHPSGGRQMTGAAWARGRGDHLKSLA